MGETEVKKSICYWCKGECGVLVHVKDGRLIKVEVDPNWPRSVWPPIKSCPRFQNALEYFYDSGRVKFTLKRAGERGEGKWQQIGWEDALDEIAGRLRKLRDRYGAETLAFLSGTGRTEEAAIQRFLVLFGTPNIAQQSTI